MGGPSPQEAEQRKGSVWREANTAKEKEKKVANEHPTEAYQFRDRSQMTDEDSSVSSSDPSEDLEVEKASKEDNQAYGTGGETGCPEDNNGGAIPHVDFRRQADRELGGGTQAVKGKNKCDGVHQFFFESQGGVIRHIRKPALLRPKKPAGSSPIGSPLESSRPKKRPRAGSEEWFDLNNCLGSGLFGGNTVIGDLEEGEVKDSDMGNQSFDHPSALDLNYVAVSGESGSLNSSFFEDVEVVKESQGAQEDGELEATAEITDNGGCCKEEALE
ncbi:hypothetical protein L1987_12054 [Smallanthus sonchifolius]|uniref:Uncharacterized protein n=1 Tax=Smallanthus sonchifolius TaxID=185202 RepID=A0ACB9JF04_9ASTR|nr:hypothetical protein L1987_12054 [Smallanthus sonchifolius]